MKHSVSYWGVDVRKAIGIILIIIVASVSTGMRHQHSVLDHWWWNFLGGVVMGIIIGIFNLLDYKSGEIEATDKKRGWDGRPL